MTGLELLSMKNDQDPKHEKRFNFDMVYGREKGCEMVFCNDETLAKLLKYCKDGKEY